MARVEDITIPAGSSLRALVKDTWSLWHLSASFRSLASEIRPSLNPYFGEQLDFEKRRNRVPLRIVRTREKFVVENFDIYKKFFALEGVPEATDLLGDFSLLRRSRRVSLAEAERIGALQSRNLRICLDEIAISGLCSIVHRACARFSPTIKKNVWRNQMSSEIFKLSSPYFLKRADNVSGIERFLEGMLKDDAVQAFEEMVNAFQPFNNNRLKVREMNKLGLVLCRLNAGMLVMKAEEYSMVKKGKRTLFFLSEDWCERLAKAISGAILLKTLAYGFVLPRLSDSEIAKFEADGAESISENGYNESRFSQLQEHFDNAEAEMALFQKNLANLCDSWATLSDRQTACERMDDVSSGGKKMWYASMVSLRTRKCSTSGQFAREDAESLRSEGSEHQWQRTFNNMVEDLSNGLQLMGADAINVRRLYYLVPLGCTSQEVFERAVASEHLKEYLLKVEETEDLTRSYCSLATRLQNLLSTVGRNWTDTQISDVLSFVFKDPW